MLTKRQHKQEIIVKITLGSGVDYKEAVKKFVEKTLIERKGIKR